MKKQEEEFKCYQLTSTRPFEDPDFDPEELNYRYGIKKSTIADFIADTEWGKLLNVDYRKDHISEVDFKENEVITVLEFESRYIDLFRGKFLMNYRPSKEEIALIKESAMNLIHSIQIESIRKNQKLECSYPIGENTKVLCENEAIINVDDSVFLHLYEGKYKKDGIQTGNTIFHYKYTPMMEYFDEKVVREETKKMHDYFIQDRFNRTLVEGKEDYDDMPF